MNETSKPSLLERFLPMLLIVTVALAFLVGTLWQKVNNLQKGNTNTNNNVAVENNNNNPPTTANGKLSDEQAKKVQLLTDSDHIRGSKNADIIMIEYSDLECPFCERFHNTAKQVLDEYGDKVAWVYRQFPLETIHPRSLPGAIASECVAKVAGNDAFWKFTDLVFTDQTTYLTEDGLKSAASKTGVNADAFNKCYTGKETEPAIRQVIAGASTAGVTGTPATYIVNKKGGIWLVPGAVPFENIKATIDEALQ